MDFVQGLCGICLGVVCVGFVWDLCEIGVAFADFRGIGVEVGWYLYGFCVGFMWDWYGIGVGSV